MIVAAAFCPNPPLLVPDVARAAAPELDDLRAACRAAIRAIASPDRQLVVLGAGPDDREHSATCHGSFAGFGVPLDIPLGSAEQEPGPVDLPLPLTVGAWLVRDALGPASGAVGRSTTGTPPALPDGAVALLVMGDGSARRSVAAPGYLDERAEAFDAGVAAALGSGAGSDLLAIDAELGGRLLAAGVPAWHAAGALLAGRRYAAQLSYQAAPYGVGYFVAAWT